MNSEKNYQILENLLKKQHHFTINDAVSATGVSVDDGKRILDKLMEKYECRLQVTEAGEIIYDFGKNTKRRGTKTFGEYWRDFSNFLYKALKIIFKIWISVVLVVYFVLFLVILLALLVLMLRGSSDSNSSSGKKGGGVGAIFELLIRVFVELFRWKIITDGIHYEKDKYGYKYKAYNHVEPATNRYSKRKKKPKKTFISSVYHFIFGEERPKIDNLGNQKEVAAFLRTKKGIIVLSEMKALAGWNNEKVESFFSDCIVRFGGETKVSENAVFYGDFPNINQAVTKENDAKIIWYWDEYEPDFKFSGNNRGRNILIFFMNIFNLTLSYFVLKFSGEMFVVEDIAIEITKNIEIFLGWIPLAFSSLFILIPIIRSFGLGFKRRKRHEENIKKRIMKAIWQSKGNTINIDDLVQNINSTQNDEEKLSKETIEKLMKDMIYDWQGESSVDDKARFVYSFPTMKRDLQEAKRLRASRFDLNNNNIAFDTNEF